MIEIIIAKAQGMAGENLKKLIEKDTELKVVGFAENCTKILTLCERALPDLILFELIEPDYDETESIRRMKIKHETLKILVLTSIKNEQHILNILNNGADGYLLKGIDSGKIITAIKNIIHGINVIDQQIYGVLLKQFNTYGYNLINNGRRVLDNLGHKNMGLSEKQLTILNLLAQGYTEQSVSLEMKVDINTIKYHKRKIFKFLNAQSSSEAIAKAMKLRLLTP